MIQKKPIKGKKFGPPASNLFGQAISEQEKDTVTRLLRVFDSTKFTLRGSSGQASIYTNKGKE